MLLYCKRPYFTVEIKQIVKKTILIFLAAPILIGLLLFVPAGTTDYWQAWVYLGVLLIPMFFVMIYFLKNDPEFLERRFQTKEKEAKQQFIIKIGTIVFLIGFLIPGFDHRFGWSQVPAMITILANIFVFVGYAFVFWVFKENSYAGRTIKVEKGQKVISTGPYSIIRHPMYLGTFLMYLATPIALGSYVALPFFIIYIPIIIYRIFNEEEVLKRELPGYSEYCTRTRYKLIPRIW